MYKRRIIVIPENLMTPITRVAHKLNIFIEMILIVAFWIYKKLSQDPIAIQPSLF